MTSQRPAPVVFAAAYQVVVGCIWFVQMSQMPGPVYKLLVASIAMGHLYAAVGLYLLCEWGRQRAVQFAMFDLISVLPMAIFGPLSPFAALLQLGMPLYTLHALNDPRVRERFS